ncbi:hypothetical protein HDV01_006238 [Terramyces sp. JEL0728]|nr:hypothetical protein HDV01_006238 [Terramyces sp. JEL0728]
MTRKVTYSLGTVPKIQKEIKQLLRQKEFALAHGDNEEYLKSTIALVENFSGTEDWYLIFNVWPKTVQHANELLKYAKKAKDLDNELFMGDYELAINFGNEWSGLAQKLGQDDEHMDATMELALAYIVKGENTNVKSNFTLAQQLLARAGNLLKVLKISSDEKERIKGDLLINMGITEKYLDNIDRSIELISRALELHKKKRRLVESAIANCNLALCYDLKREYEKALKYGLDDQKLRHEMNDRIDESKAMWENVLRYEKLFLFQEAKDLLKTYTSMAKEDDARELLPEEKMDNLNRMLENLDKIKILGVRIDRTDKKSNARAKAGYYEERGKLKLDCGMGKAAAQDFLHQKKICMDLKSSPETISKILINLGKSVLLDGKYAESERYLSEGLKYFRGPAQEEIEIRFQLYEAMSDPGFGNSRQPYENQLEKIVVLCQEVNNLVDEEAACLKLRELHLYYNLQDLVNIDDLRLKRIRNKMPDTNESQDSEVYTDNIEIQDSLEDDIYRTKSTKRIEKTVLPSPAQNNQPSTMKKRKIAGFDQVYSDNIANEMQVDDPIQFSSQDSSINPPKAETKTARRIRSISVDSTPPASPKRIPIRTISPDSTQSTSSIVLANRYHNRVIDSSSSLEERSGKTAGKIKVRSSETSLDELNEKFNQDFESVIESYTPAIVNDEIVTVLGTPREKDSIDHSNKLEKAVRTHGFDDGVDEPLAKSAKQRNRNSDSPKSEPAIPHSYEKKPRKSSIMVNSCKSVETASFNREILSTLELVQETAPVCRESSQTSNESRIAIPNSFEYNYSPDLQSNLPLRSNSLQPNQQTPPRKRNLSGSFTSPSSIPKTPVINRTANTPEPHRLSYTPVKNFQPSKIRKIQVEYTTPKKSNSKFTIPYYNGPNGTPKTFKWLLDETRRRYIDRHDVPGRIDKLVNEEGEVLCSWDVIEHMVEENEKVKAI